MSDEPSWPIFPLVARCDGRCKRRRDSYIRKTYVQFGDIAYEVAACGCYAGAEDAACAIFDELGSPLVERRHEDRNCGFIKSVMSVGWWYRYHFRFSEIEKATQCDVCGWSIQQDDEWKRIGRTTSRSAKEWMDDIGKLFDKYDMTTIEMQSYFRSETCVYVNKRSWVDDEPYWTAEWKNVCSIECCSLAIDTAITKEREERQRQRELKCVQEVQKVSRRFRAAMQSRNRQEALQSLKKEFEQAANSP